MLETLASELITFILCECTSSKDLFRLLSASPTCLRVFCSAREQTLYTVLRNSVPAAVEIDIAAVCHAQDYNTNDGHNTDTGRGLGMEGVNRFMDAYLDGGFALPTSRAELVAAHRLMNRVTYFVDAFVDAADAQMKELSDDWNRRMEERDARRAAKALQDGQSPAVRVLGQSITWVKRTALSFQTKPLPEPPSPDRAIVQKMSQTELTRLHRAVLRLELLGCLCRTTSPALTCDEQAQCFLSRLPAWEVEEMACIHAFYTHRLWNALAESVRCVPGRRKEGRHSARHLGIDMPFTVEDLNSREWPLYLAGLTVRGVGFLYNALVEQKGRREGGRRPDPDAVPGELVPGVAVSGFFVAAVDRLSTQRESSGPGERVGEDAMKEDAGLGPTAAFMRFSSPPYGSCYRGILKNERYNTLRYMGYILWDEERSEEGPVRVVTDWIHGMSLGGSGILPFRDEIFGNERKCPYTRSRCGQWS